MTAPTATSRAAAERSNGPSLVGTAGGIVVVVSVTALAWWIGRNLWFFSDDWNIYADYHAGGLLEPFNGHLSLVPAGAYQALFHTMGVESYWPYRVVGIAGWITLGWQLFQFARARIGDAPAVLATAAVMWSSAASTNIMFPFLVNYSLPIAALIGAWRALDRESTRGDVVASVWLTVALATSGLGLMSVGAVVVELAVRRAPLRRWLVLAPGPLLWFVWYLGHREATPITDDIGTAVSYAARMVMGGFTALAAGSKPAGVVLALIALGLMGVVVASWRSFGARTLGALAALVAFCATTALTRVDIVPQIPPDEIRYRWAVATYLVLVVITAWPALRNVDATAAGTTEPAAESVPVGRPVGPVIGSTAVGVGALAIVAVMLALGAVRLVDAMHDWTDTAVSGKPGLRAVLFAVETVGDRADGAIVLPLSYVPVTTEGYLGAVDDVGSPLDGTVLTAGGQRDQLDFADRYLVEQSEMQLVSTALDATCAPLPPTGEIGSDARLAVVAAAAAPVGISRFGDQPVALDAPAGASALTFPMDRRGMDAEDVPYRVSAPAGVTLFSC